MFTVGDILRYLKMSWVNIFSGLQNSVHFDGKYLDFREGGNIYSFRTTKFYAFLGDILRYRRGRGFDSIQIPSQARGCEYCFIIVNAIT